MGSYIPVQVFIESLIRSSSVIKRLLKDFKSEKVFETDGTALDFIPPEGWKGYIELTKVSVR